MAAGSVEGEASRAEVSTEAGAPRDRSASALKAGTPGADAVAGEDPATAQAADGADGRATAPAADALRERLALIVR
jgi:hypothetical protein